MALLQRQAADNKYREWEFYASITSGFTLCDKFLIVNQSLREEPLGRCGLLAGVEYRVVSFERQNPQSVFQPNEDLFLQLTHVTDPVLSYRPPPRYARMVSEKDAAIVNWGYRKYNILREKKPVHMVSRVHFDHKAFTWDLVLREVRR
jgi:hypothetical protein